MTEQPEIKISDLSRVALSPDDVLVYRAPNFLDRATHERLMNAFRQAIPGTRVLVHEGGGELAVVTPTDVRGFSEWHLGTLQHLYEHADRAMAEEGVDGELRGRIMRRIVYGTPDPEAFTTRPVAQPGSL